MLFYRGYRTAVEFDSESPLFCGNVEGMKDAVYFEAESASNVEHAFHEAVDDYLAFCAEKGKEPERPSCVCAKAS